MKIVVVEDEPKTRNGIIKIIEKYTEHEVVADEADGLAGLEKVLVLQPDVVITDINMPLMDGLTMLEKVREKGQNVAAVVLTGYSEFEYAQKAIQLSVVEYLLKPMDVDDIVEVLVTIANRISKDQIESVSAEQLLFSMYVEGENNQSSIQKQFAEKIKYQTNQNMALFLIKSESMMKETTNEMVAALKSSLDAICLTRFEVFKLPFKKTILVMIMDVQNTHYLKEMFQMRVIRDLKQIGECLISYEEITQIAYLKETILKMQDYFEYAFAFREDRILDAKLIDGKKFLLIEYPEQLENTIRRDIRNGNKKGIRNMADKFQSVVIEGQGEPRVIRQYTARFAMAILDVACDILENKNLESYYNYWVTGLLQTNNKEIFLGHYHKMIELVLGNESEENRTENGLILNAITYMRQNYNRDISLSETADVIGITPEYLSKLFAKEMGINFSTFLGEFRISVAKKLLTTSNYKICEVAEKVGFKDTKYFNKVFKSIIGVSPSDYKKKAQ